MFRIGEFAQIAQVSGRQLRFYDQLGSAAAGAYRCPDRLSLLQHSAIAALEQHPGAEGTRDVAGADQVRCWRTTSLRRSSVPC